MSTLIYSQQLESDRKPRQKSGQLQPHAITL